MAGQTRIDHAFFERSTPLVAHELIGKLLLHETVAGTVGGRIVETEAYLGKDDPACHAAKGMTKRNAHMFGTAGRNYIYRSYGIHLCYNITSDSEDLPAAVLIRALEPTHGIKLMYKNRSNAAELKQHRLATGPGNLAKALGLGLELSGCSVISGLLGVYDDGFAPDTKAVTVCPRIGISQAVDLPLRYYLSESRSVSKK